MVEVDAPMRADLAVVAARFGAALRAEGVPVDPARCQRFATAVELADPRSTTALYWCAEATLIADPAHLPALRRVFAAVFGGAADPAGRRGEPGAAAVPAPRVDREPTEGLDLPDDDRPRGRRRGEVGAEPGRSGGTERAGRTEPYPAVAAAAERLAHRDFATLTAEELALLVSAMRRLRLAPPLRRSRRLRSGVRGGAVDLRATLRRASHTAGQPVRLRRRRPRWRRRRLVVLVDISGSMAPYARALLQLLYCAAGGVGAGDSEVFSFATRLTRLTRVMRHVPPAVALERAGAAAPDWAGGTRIGAALREFTDRYGARGLARGAVLVVVSDGWDTGDPAVLARVMARLSRLAYRIVWVNPRSAEADYRPLVRGMAAAWPYCDAVVSGHRLAALAELVAAIGAPGQSRPALAHAACPDPPAGRPGRGGTEGGEVDTRA